MMRRKIKKRPLDNISWGGKGFVTVFVLIVIALNYGFLEVYAEIYSNLDLKESIVPLKTTKAGSGFEDLEPLKEILKDKKIVAMGEATHGTKEFFEMKHRIFEFLVEEMGYRAFAIEAEFGEAEIINDYILNDIGNIDDVMDTFSIGFWRTKEILQMIEWMKSYNENHQNTEKIRFYGLDMQLVNSNLNRNGGKILSFLEKVDKEIDSKYRYNLNTLRRGGKVNTDSIEELRMIFDENKESYIAQTSILEYEVTYQYLGIIAQWMNFKEVTNFIDAANKRDQYMAENVEWILNYEKHFNNDKIMIWAHNGHVSKKFINYKPMGEHLKERYNKELYVIGLDFYKGSFRSKPSAIFGKVISHRLAEFTIENGHEKSFAAGIERMGIPIGFIDFEMASRDDRISEWLSKEHYFCSIGAVYLGKYIPMLAPQIPIESYDGIIYMDKTTASEIIDADQYGIPNGERYLLIYYSTRITLIVLIFITIVIFIKRKKCKKLIH